MMKKLAIVVVALAIAAPAFAATVTNKGKQLILSVNVANSGVNQTNSKSGKITTGHSAVISDTEASLNTTQIDHSKNLSVKNLFKNRYVQNYIIYDLISIIKIFLNHRLPSDFKKIIKTCFVDELNNIYSSK